MGPALSTLAASIAVPLAGGTLIGLALKDETRGVWYKTLKKPSWNPPAWVFGPVWTALYSAMGYASWRVWQAGGGQLPLGLYAAQLALNFAWSPLFFGAKALGVAAVDITALVGMVAATIYEFQKVDPVAAQLLYPYLAWVTFAAALNYNLAANNPSGQAPPDPKVI
ncbi:hypothetical protein ACKKBG_A27660 [Auxenochlorella protothecoides x Auxenochlorella symbiontica]|uniref:Translocator protein n=1 Tax=Auxenochlorella protothecoides TaxID=3075 RepID=A0A1D2A614_AUXPR